MYKLKTIFVLLLGLSVFLTGCARISVKRLSTDKIVDISGSWNDTDSRLVAEEMISDCLKRPWLNKFNETNNSEPVIIVGTVINRSHEHINSRLFTKNLEKSLLNSGLIKFVTSRTEREGIREGIAKHFRPHTLGDVEDDLSGFIHCTGTMELWRHQADELLEYLHSQGVVVKVEFSDGFIAPQVTAVVPLIAGY